MERQMSLFATAKRAGMIILMFQTPVVDELDIDSLFFPMVQIPDASVYKINI
jgi:hypothetical protein